MITTKLSRFGERELLLASNLLKAYITRNETVYFKHIYAVEFNQETGLVYLRDIEGNKAVYRDWQNCLEDWIECPECGNGNYYRNFMLCNLECCRDYFLELSKKNNIFKGEKDESN